MRVVFTVYSFISIAFSPMRLAPCAGKKQDACKLMPNVIAPQFFFPFLRSTLFVFVYYRISAVDVVFFKQKMYAF